MTRWSYCPTCYVRTEQELERIDEKFEYYKCTHCGQVQNVPKKISNTKLRYVEEKKGIIPA